MGSVPNKTVLDVYSFVTHLKTFTVATYLDSTFWKIKFEME